MFFYIPSAVQNNFNGECPSVMAYILRPLSFHLQNLFSNFRQNSENPIDIINSAERFGRTNTSNGFTFSFDYQLNSFHLWWYIFHNKRIVIPKDKYWKCTHSNKYYICGDRWYLIREMHGIFWSSKDKMIEDQKAEWNRNNLYITFWGKSRKYI